MGPYLSTPIRDKETETGQGNRFRYAATSMQGWRNSQEDAHTATCDLEPNICCFGVFDGHGGKEVSMFVAAHFWNKLKANSNFQMNNMSKALEENFLEMDKLIQTPAGKREVQGYKACGDPNQATISQAGWTAVVALINEQQLIVANAGDSRCVLSRGGQAVAMSNDHKPEDHIERQRIYNAGCTILDGRVNGNINLSRALGDLEYKENKSLPPEEQAVTAFPDIKETTLQPDDEFIVLAWDGIWDVLSNQSWVDIINNRRGKESLDKIAEYVCDRCLARDVASSGGLGCDNMTVIIVELK